MLESLEGKFFGSKSFLKRRNTLSEVLTYSCDHDLLYRFSKVVGIEYLGGLHKEALKYEGKYKRLGGAPTQFINKDFTDPSIKLNDADVIFAYATK